MEDERADRARDRQQQLGGKRGAVFVAYLAVIPAGSSLLVVVESLILALRPGVLGLSTQTVQYAHCSFISFCRLYIQQRKRLTRKFGF